jgi:hypothetical protein
MTGTPEPGRRILLFPLEDTEPGPLHRWLGREAWLSMPVAALRYEPDGDRIVFRLVDAPSMACGVLDADQPPAPVGDFFLGFDGTGGEAWPTTIALLDFGRHLDLKTSQLGVIRELVGGEVLAAARALRLTAVGGWASQRVAVSPEEADRLTRRWRDLVIPGDVVLEAEFAGISEWPSGAGSSSEWPNEEASSRQDGRGSSSVSVAQRTVTHTDHLWAQRVQTPTEMSRQEAQERSSSEGGRQAERHVAEPTATGVGATMPGGPRQAADDRPPQPAEDKPLGRLPYGIVARLVDIWAARRDGGADVPRLPSMHGLRDPDDPRHGITPYLEVRNREFREDAERERHRMLAELRETYQLRAEIRQQIADADATADTVHQLLENMPHEPAEPDRRYALELHLPESLVRARRQRELQNERAKILAQELQARKAVTELRGQEARLTEAIAHREKQMHARVRQLLEHSLRRCGTYTQHIVHHHPDTGAVIPYLTLALPSAPGWLPHEDTVEPPPGAAPEPQAGAEPPDPFTGSGYPGSPNGHHWNGSSVEEDDVEEEDKDAEP